MSLKDFQNDLAKSIYKITKNEALQRGICIECKKPPVFYSEAGEREYRISGLCEPCWDAILKEEFELYE